jgi:DNA-binding transcriptional MerR regulator/methylmalonyl-CoA mutase cobalamin-binding subunit
MSTTGQSEADDHEGGEKVDEPLSIHQVSTELGVPAPTLRSWERRYGVPVAGRSQGGHRRYDQAQLAELLRMRDLVASGTRPGEAAAQLRAALETSTEGLVASFVDAAYGLEPSAIREVLDTARQVWGLDRTVDDVLLPALREIGSRWERGEGDVGHEHLASHATQTWLAQASTAKSPPTSGPLILCCGPRDHHTLGLEALGALLRHRGWDCRLLGARTPVESLVLAAQTTGAAGIVLVCHLPANRAAAVEALSSPALSDVRLFYAGGAFTTYQARQGVPGRYLGLRMSAAADVVTTALSTGSTAGPTGTDPR